MKKQQKMIPYLLIHVIAFYLLPMFIQNTGTAVVVMLIGLPLICLVTSIVFGVKQSMNRLYPILVALLFAPTILIFYNSSAVFYIVVYGCIAFAGNLIGKLFYKQTQ